VADPTQIDWIINKSDNNQITHLLITQLYNESLINDTVDITKAYPKEGAVARIAAA
jgi:hypothetical protein